jgi:chemotaxis methyl-accepting protein methylase
MTEGIEDYEMLQALKARDPVEADRLGKEAVAGFTDYVRDPSQFRSIEKQLLEDLAK